MRMHGILALMLLCAYYAPLDAHAATCSNASLRGSYVMSVTGAYTTVADGALAADYIAVGQLSPDGVGGLTGVMTMSSNGQIARRVAITGTYAVEVGCTGTVEIDFLGGGNLSFDIFLGRSGFIGIETDANMGLVASFTSSGFGGNAQAATCSNASLSGDYVISLTSEHQTNQFGAVGKLSADGVGALTGVMYGQGAGGLAITGTYAVEVDCTGSAWIDFPGGGILPLDIFLTGRGFGGIDITANMNLVASAALR